MATIPNAGTPITAEEADKYLKKFVEIRENLQIEAMPITTRIRIESQNMDVLEELNTFYTADVNAFIFSRSLVERFFSGLNENEQPQPKADYLMVITGAKYKGPDIIGTPTVVIAGVNKEADNTYRSLNIPYAADQQPPVETIVEFPKSSSTETGLDLYKLNVFL